MSSRSYFYNKHTYRSRSYSGRKKIYGSAYQPGKTTRYQRYGRTMRLDPSYINIPRELPTRQSQLRQVEELRKAGLIPENAINIEVEGISNREPLSVYSGGDATAVSIPVVEKGEENKIIYVNVGMCVERVNSSSALQVKMYNVENTQIWSESYNSQYANFEFSLNFGSNDANYMLSTMATSAPYQPTSQNISNTKLTDISNVVVRSSGAGSETVGHLVHLKSIAIRY